MYIVTVQAVPLTDMLTEMSPQRGLKTVGVFHSPRYKQVILFCYFPAVISSEVGQLINKE